MANTVRGEVDVDLGGKQYTLRMDFTAMEMIETQTKTGLMVLLRSFMTSTYKASDAATVVWACANVVLLEKKQAPLDLGWVGSKMMEKGFKEYSIVVSEFLFRALAGPKIEAPLEDASGAQGSGASEAGKE